MLNLKKILLGGVAALFVVGISATAQMWYPFPEVGGPAFCSSTVNNTCVNTVPAGPALTGNETIPLDTNKTGGSSPQTAKASIATVGLGGIQNAAPLTGTTVQIAPGVGRVLINPAGTIAAFSLLFPAKTQLFDGQVLVIASSQTITNLYMTLSTGTTAAETLPTTITAATPITLMYSSASSKWFLLAPAS